MAEEGTETQGGAQQQTVAPKTVILTNSMADALEGLVPKGTLQKVQEAEFNALKTSVDEGLKKTGEAKPVEDTKTKPAAATEPASDDKKAAEETKVAEKAKKDLEAYNKMSDEEKGKLSAEDKKKFEDLAKKATEPAKNPLESISLFGNKVNKKKDAPAKIEKVEDLIETANKELGFSFKDLGDTTKMFETAKKWRSDSQTLVEVQKEAENYKAILEGLPENFITSIDTFYKGGDWKKAIGDVPKFDFNKPVEKQNTDKLVEHYFPGKFTEADFKEETPSAALQIAIDASKDKFITEQKAREDARAAQRTKASNDLEKFKASVSGSVDHLKQSFPDILPEIESEISGILTGGAKEVVNLIFNKDGTVKKEAAEQLMFLKHGKTEMLKMMHAASNIAETKSNEDILTRGADKPGEGVKRDQRKTETISEGTKNLLGELGQFKTKKTF